ncbi:MAG: putative amidohydrolase/ribosomal protein S18 acetylase RimI-like enzyme [Candidatus Marinamargulisbacteria bacterium]|jgi:predicted amidohydrolase/ribosomal protein S18 acetylase RimI-like enzyme
MMSQKQKRTLHIRGAQKADIPAILELSKEVYADFPPYTKAHLTGHINTFPKGQFVAVYDDAIIGYCASIQVMEKRALSKHNWHEVTGGGYGSTHDPDGDYLYGMEVFVDPAFRGIRVGERFYQARKKLCTECRLKGIVFGGRLPSLSRKIKQVKTAQAYIEAVETKKIRDNVLSFQLHQGFEVIGILENYLPADKESMGKAAHLLWKNPEQTYEVENKKRYGQRQSGTVRLASVQYQQRKINSFDEFKKIVTYFVDVVSDYNSDFVVFPELFTLQLLSIENETVPPNEAIDHLTKYTPRLTQLFTQLAIQYNVNIIAGSHPTKKENGDIQNICLVCLRDGSIHEQAKIHPTPNESYWWNIQGGESLDVIETDCGPIGVLICYDAEFPELGRHLVDQGASILFVPFCTDERQSYLRVRYCAQARAVENQVYVVMSGNVGNLPSVPNMDIQYAQSCILTPCDFPFARDGIAADTTPNAETVIFADLRSEDLQRARHTGTVQNLKDRRHDLYNVVWKK